MNKYSVLLLYPDYIAEDYGQVTYLAHVEAEDHRIAIIQAQREASLAQGDNEEDVGEDFYPLLCIEGHHDNLVCGGEPVMIGE